MHCAQIFGARRDPGRPFRMTCGMVFRRLGIVKNDHFAGCWRMGR
jgi:hypothetical protein